MTRPPSSPQRARRAFPPAHGWAVYDRDGNINNVSFWRPNAIASATSPGVKDHWKYLRKQGYTCRPVLIVEHLPARRGGR